MLGYKFAPLVFASIDDLEGIVAKSKLEASFEMARSRIPTNTLGIRSLGKFHEIGDSINKPSIEYLAQIELIDMPHDDVSISQYVRVFIGKEYGRISVVGRGRTSYDLEAQFGMLSRIADRATKIKSFMEKMERREDVPTKNQLYDELVWHTSAINQLSDFRAQNGFSSVENMIYGNVALFCLIYAVAMRTYFEAIHPEIAEDLKGTFASLRSGITLGKLAEFTKMVESPNGVNLPIYFTPRIRPEVANVI